MLHATAALRCADLRRQQFLAASGLNCELRVISSRSLAASYTPTCRAAYLVVK